MEIPNYRDFYCEIGELRETLQRDGVAVIRSVLDAAELDEVRDAQWAQIEGMTARLPIPLRRDAPETYRTWFELFPMHSMLVQHYGIGQTYPWLVRGNIKVSRL